jgi:CG-1 domain
VLRFFRKDGHSWRKKKDGRTVGEAHERLKVLFYLEKVPTGIGIVKEIKK